MCIFFRYQINRQIQKTRGQNGHRGPLVLPIVGVVYKSRLEPVKALWITVKDNPRIPGLVIHTSAKVIEYFICNMYTTYLLCIVTDYPVLTYLFLQYCL